MASKQGRSRRHTHREKKPLNDGFSQYTARKTCETCGKACYLTRDEAKRSARVSQPGKVMHAYQCTEPSGQTWWHMSSIPADKLKELRDRGRR